MIEPEKLDINSLPWLPIEQSTVIPGTSGVYFAINENQIIHYIKTIL